MSQTQQSQQLAKIFSDIPSAIFENVNFRDKVAEMKSLLSLADAAHEAVFCLMLHYYYGNTAKKLPSTIQVIT